MIEYIVPSNIDDRVLRRACGMLEDGALVALPTDTSWSIVCSLRSKTGIKKLRDLSGEREERFFTLLCSGISQFADVCIMDNTRYRIIKRLSPGPYVFILKTLPGTEKYLDIRRNELGVRIPDYPVPVSLINTLGHPLYSITAKRTMTGSDETDADNTDESDTELKSFPEDELFESGWELEDITGLDLILDGGEEREKTFSTILDMCTDEVKLLRNGAGPWPV